MIDWYHRSHLHQQSAPEGFVHYAELHIVASFSVMTKGVDTVMVNNSEIAALDSILQDGKY